MVSGRGFDGRVLQVSQVVDRAWRAAVAAACPDDPPPVAQLPLGLVVVQDRITACLQVYPDASLDVAALHELRSAPLLSRPVVRTPFSVALLVSPSAPFACF